MGRQLRNLRRGVEEKLVTAVTTGASTMNIPNYGVTHLTKTTVAQNYVLDAPAEGVMKTIVVTGVTTASTSVALTVQGSTDAAAAVKFGNATATQFSVTATSAAAPNIAGISLVGLNSTLWGVVSQTTGIVLAASA